MCVTVYTFIGTIQSLLVYYKQYYYCITGLSYYEQVLGNYLASCGELDFTLAGQIMTKTGGLHKNNAEIRLKQLPALLRVQAETTTFATSGLGDLAFSIDNLERTRKEYRAALLWMKDVSEKLHNPDARGQLVRFREVRSTTIIIIILEYHTTTNNRVSDTRAL